MNQEALMSCFQCASLYQCYEEVHKLDSQQARDVARCCTSWHKGLNKEVIQVLGRRRGMSRKNAQRLCTNYRAAYIGPALLALSKQPSKDK